MLAHYQLGVPMGNISIEEAASKKGVSGVYIRRMAREGRIPGAQQISGVWVIPEDFEIVKSNRPRGRPRSVEKSNGSAE